MPPAQQENSRWLLLVDNQALKFLVVVMMMVCLVVKVVKIVREPKVKTVKLECLHTKLVQITQ